MRAHLCLTLCNPMDCSPPGFSVHGDSPDKSTVVCCHALLQGVFPTQGFILGLLHCKWVLYRLSHQGSPRWSLSEDCFQGLLDWPQSQCRPCCLLHLVSVSGTASHRPQSANKEMKEDTASTRIPGAVFTLPKNLDPGQFQRPTSQKGH